MAGENLVVDGNLELHAHPEANGFNVRSPDFNRSYKHVHSFGEYGGIDIVNGEAKPEVAGPGNTRLQLAWNGVEAGDKDAIALELHSGGVRRGEDLHLIFWAERLRFGDAAGRLEIGLSASKDKFGTRIHTWKIEAEKMTKFERVFSAPVDARYLTVRPKQGHQQWLAVDAFALRRVDVITDVAPAHPRLRLVSR